MTLLKDLIEIPEYLDEGQFVFKLNECLEHAEQVVSQYVVTDALQKRFEEAIEQIRLSMADGRSRSCYLHGSFGSGKSHFMGILHLILTGNVHGRGIRALSGTINKHSEWMDGKKFLLVPYHMIGSESSETGILGGYAKYIRKLHPDASIPGVYRAESLFEDAINLKNQISAEKFFEGLNKVSGGSGASAGATGGFGNITRGWDEARFNRAMGLHHGEEDRGLLISALSKAYYKSYGLQVENETSKFVDLENGLAVMCQHAKSLGYDAVILFLDELILWLSGKATNLDFVTNECMKLVKLVEAQNLNERPIPLISFIARQRDLGELVGESVPGAEKQNFNSLLHRNDKRFHPITLEDSNLPAIAEIRVLAGKTPTSKEELHGAFNKFVTDPKNKHAIDALLTRDYTQDMFRQVYPFSPALIQTLIAISSLLQRERTALKIMVQLLVEQRDELEIGDLIPVGDLFDLVAYGENAFNTEMKQHFENARNLYERKLLPELEKKHGVSREQYRKLEIGDPLRRRFRNDDRLAKTLLLSALVPDVEALRGLTAKRLAYLNHGTIKVINAGEEGAMVLDKVRSWARIISAIKIGEGSDPTITVQLSDVDTDSIIAKAEEEDNHGNRIRLIRQTVYRMAGVTDEGEFEQFYDWQWKNTSRSCILLFKNVVDLKDASLQNDDDRWKLVIDYPFDQSHGPMDDVARLREFKDKHLLGTKTICWLPAFFSDEANADLGLLVRLEHILAGERFENYVGHLSPQKRPSARASLDSQRSVLRESVRVHIEAAYGLIDSSPESLHRDKTIPLSERFFPLANGLNLRPPTKPNFREAMEQLLGQALEQEFPGAPEFEAKVTANHAKKVLEIAIEAAQSKERRAEVDDRFRSTMRGIANPLKLGVLQHDRTHFVIDDHWKTHILRKHAASGDDLTVGAIRKWIDEPKVMGLPDYMKNLIVILFAQQTDHAFYYHNVLDDHVSVTRLDNCELRGVDRPDEQQWKEALDLAYRVFGSTISSLNNANNIAKLFQETRETANDVISSVTQYRAAVVAGLQKMNVDAGTSRRLQTADACISLIAQIQASQNSSHLIGCLANANVPTSKDAMGRCCGQASVLAASLETKNFDLLAAIGKLSGSKQSEADDVLKGVRIALVEDEHVKAIGITMQHAVAASIRLLTPDPPPVIPAPDPTTPAPKTSPPTSPGKKLIEQDSLTSVDLSVAESKLKELKTKLESNKSIRIDLTWVIEQADDGADEGAKE